MIRLNSYKFIVIGLFVRYLRNAESESSKSVIGGIDQLVKCLEEMGFRVALNGSDELMSLRDELAILPESVQLSAVQGKSLGNIMATLERIIFAEAQTKQLFITTEKRYSLEFLLDQPAKLFAPDVYGAISEISRYDFREGFRCIAFGLPTAAAFHILRGTESVLKDLYLKKVRRDREDKPMWGNMVEGLRRKKKAAPSRILLDSLDMIRRSYRNPTLHPETRYDVNEVQDLLGLCIDAVNKMVSSL